MSIYYASGTRDVVVEQKSWVFFYGLIIYQERNTN